MYKTNVLIPYIDLQTQKRRWEKIEGYYIKGLGLSTGTLHIEVKNLPEFEKLISQAKK